MLRRALVLALVSASAQANVAASRRKPAVLAMESSTRVRTEVLSEALTFDCAGADRGSGCAFEAIYRLRNSEDEPEEIVAAFLGVRTREVRVEVDGHPVDVDAGEIAGRPWPTQSDAPPANAADAIARASEADVIEGIQQVEFGLSMAARTEATLTVRGQLALEQRFLPGGYVWPAIRARHLVSSGEVRRPEIYDIDYLLGPIRTWAGNPTIAVTVRFPADWEIGSSRVPTAYSEPDPAGWQVRRAGSVSVATREVRAAGERDRLQIALTKPEPALRLGGPQIALGATVGDNARFRIRAGYQMAFPQEWLHSLSVDTDFQRLILTPLSQYSTPQVILLPMLGAGIGVPLQVLPNFRAGVRLLADVHFAPLGFVFTWDYYPGFGGAPAISDLAFMGEVSF